MVEMACIAKSSRVEMKSKQFTRQWTLMQIPASLLDFCGSSITDYTLHKAITHPQLITRSTTPLLETTTSASVVSSDAPSGLPRKLEMPLFGE